MEKIVPIIIPAYEPDGRLIELLHTIPITDNFIIIVDDGSGDDYQSIFHTASELIGEYGIVIEHDVNKGKGRALKSAFEYVRDNVQDAVGVVTADSDGQHTIEAIEAVKKELVNNANSLILGVRSFDGEGIPWNSKFGNKITAKLMGYITGVSVSDTQTGLRGIPMAFLKELIDIPGERFEFETEMLAESYGKYQIVEVGIETIYDSKDNHQTHFRPFADSAKIYKVLGRRYLKFVMSSLSSSVIDLILFTLLCHFLKTDDGVLYVSIATVFARIISASYNYVINYILVFKSKESVSKSLLKYIALAIVQMLLSAFLTTSGVKLFAGISETIIKIIVDIVLFILSYMIQQRVVFNKK